MRLRRHDGDDIFDEFGEPPVPAPEPAAPDTPVTAAAPADLLAAAVDDRAEPLAVEPAAPTPTDLPEDVDLAARAAPPIGDEPSTAGSGTTAPPRLSRLLAAGAVLLAILMLAVVVLPNVSSSGDGDARLAGPPSTTVRAAPPREQPRAARDASPRVRLRHRPRTASHRARHERAPRSRRPATAAPASPAPTTAAPVPAPAPSYTAAPNREFTFER
jgi:hypothetical protein